MQDTKSLLFSTRSDFPAVRREKLRVLQVNLGYRCNLSCSHCHVNAGPNRSEAISAATAQKVVAVLQRWRPECLDLTGGAPELSAHFRYLVNAATDLNIEVIDRCNLTVLMEPGQEETAAFLATNRVRVVASLPCYSSANVDAQRGKGVFDGSIQGLKQLNSLGYGQDGTGLMLDLVYNPGGFHLPPAQAELERTYKEKLAADFGVQFNRLLTLTNVPINRFGAQLIAKGQYDHYLKLLQDNFSEQNLAGLMCRDTVSVDWQGRLFDCDFNQMLDAPMANQQGPLQLDDLLQDDGRGQGVWTADHCYACTAGQGSSCGGALSS